MKDSNRGLADTNINRLGLSLVNLWILEDMQMERDEYAKDATIKEQFRKDPSLNQPGRLRMDSAEEIRGGYGGHPVNECGPSCDTASPMREKLETIEQERNRLSRRLAEAISYNENVIRTLREMLSRTESHQKNAYILMESLHTSSRNQIHDLNNLREFLK